jgi:aspartate/methionine/tyrosine aminotransferase
MFKTGGDTTMKLAKQVFATDFPPIAEAMSWVAPGAIQSGRNRDLLNMCQAVPSYPPAPALQQEFARLAGEPGTGGYTDIFGLGELREVYAKRMSLAYLVDIRSDRVAITTGCNQAFAAAVMSVAEAGDEVILPAPHYFNHEMWLNMLGVRNVTIPAIGSSGHPLVADARAAITPRTRAILLCTPNNPSGAIYPADVIQSFFELAREHGIALIMDETYRDFRPTTEPPHALFSQPGWEETVIHLYSFSKIYAIAGYRLGAMCSGPKLLHEAAKILDCMTICPPQIAQRGVLFALGAVDDWINEKKTVMAGRLAAVRQALADPALRYRLISSGAYFAYIQHPFAGEKSKTVAKRLAQEHDVLCLPGSMFGEGQEDYLRLAFANVDEEKMVVLAERLKESQGST